jgi:threonine aldolase
VVNKDAENRRASIACRMGVDGARTAIQGAGMRFFSDNAAAACPEALAAIAEANRIDTAYDGDAWSRRLNAAFSDLFERDVEALWVATGTAANSLALAALCPSHAGIICHRDAHIENDECGAPEF